LGAASHKNVNAVDTYYNKGIKYLIYGNILKNATYPLSVSSERVFQALEVLKHVNELGADAVAHGSTGAGNDQVRFDIVFEVLAPQVEIIAPVRDNCFTRQFEIDFLQKHGFDFSWEKAKYSINQGLWGTSIGGVETLSSDGYLPEEAYPTKVTKTVPEHIKIGFLKGEPVSFNGVEMNPVEVIKAVRDAAAPFGIGRDIHIGDTIIGIKGRVGFEAAAPMLIIAAHKFLEKYTLSKWQQYWKDQVANWYGMFLHESQYLEPVMRDIEAMLESSQRNVTGTAILKLMPKHFETVGVDSPNDLVKNKLGEYGEVQKGWTAEDAKGFIKVTSTPLRAYYASHPDEKI
ncbi:MAG: argininosuccinate synthase, partial [Bacteroidaceae bacterium]|nr:argininosuccinate synthase [Bacteroidaceae bacterium]